MERNSCNCNNNIHCTVASCAHHNQPNNCCSLQSIRVGCSDSSPTPVSYTHLDVYKRQAL